MKSRMARRFRPHGICAWTMTGVIFGLVLGGSLSMTPRAANAQQPLAQSERPRDTRDVRAKYPKLVPASEPSIDGDLTDLIDYIHLLQENETGCALEISDPDSEIVFTEQFQPCSPVVGQYFENGFDQILGLIAFNGTDLLLGVRTKGIIGDPDGDGDPGTDCGTNIIDAPGIGPFESYKWFLDTNCDATPDIAVIVNNNQVSVSGMSYTGTEFNYNGHELEVRVTGVSLAPQFRGRSFAGSDVDGLSEDLSDEQQCDPITPTLDITKLVGDVCEGQATTVSITVQNTSVVLLDPVVIEDDLPAGFTYAGSVTGIGDPVSSNGHLTFPGFSLDPNEMKTITFKIQAPADCSGQHSNTASVTGTFTHPCNPETNHERLAFNQHTATFECMQIEVFVADAEVCPGGTTELCAEIVEGVGPFSYSWTGPGEFTSQESCITVGVEGDYTVTVTDGHGCTDTTSGHLTVNPSPVADAGPGKEFCAGGAGVQIGGNPTASGGAPEYTYAWTPATGLDDDAIANPTASPSATTTYTVTVTDSKGCTAADEVVVTVNPNPVADAGPDVKFCAGGSAPIGGSPTASGGTPGYTYAWTPATGLDDDTIANPTASPSATTTYTVTVTDDKGCTGTDEVVVTVSPEPVADAGPDKEFCAGGQGVGIGGSPTASGGTPGYTYSWTPTEGLDNAAIANPNANPAGTTTYTVTVTDSDGCTATDEVVVTVNPLPVADAGPDKGLCEGDEGVPIGGSPTASEGIPGYTYSWTPTEGLDNASAANPTATPASTTTYTVTVTDSKGCTAADEVVVTVNPNPACEVTGPTPVCVGSQDLPYSVGCGNPVGTFAYAWEVTAGDATIDGSTTGASVTVDAATESFTLQVTVTDASSTNCAAVFTKDVTVSPHPEITVIPGNACVGDEGELCAGISGGMAPFTYNWSGPGEFSAQDSCITAGAGLYTVTVTDAHGCSGTASGQVNFFEPSLDASADDAEVCKGQDAIVMVTITNTANGAETFRLECTVDGVPIPAMDVGEVPSGENKVVPVSIPCEEADTLDVSCEVVATLVGSPDCTAKKTVDAKVICLAPEIALNKWDDLPERECAADGNVVTYTLEVENTGPVDLVDIVLTDEVMGPVAYFVDSAVPTPNISPTGGEIGSLRWEEPGPLKPGDKMLFTYQVILSVDGDCSGEPQYETEGVVEAFCGEARATDTASVRTCIRCPVSCWMTAGGFLNEGVKNGHKEDNFGGNVGPPPRGSWQHVQRVDNKVVFNFHSHDVNVIACYHDGEDGPCHPEAEDNVIEFGGTGVYSEGNGRRDHAAVWTARAEDHGEPGNNPKRNNGGCGSPDFYTIEVRDAGTDAVVFTAEGFLDGGNVQIHKNVGPTNASASDMVATDARPGDRFSTGDFDAALTDAEVRLFAYPNPVTSGSTTIQYNVPERLGESRVELRVYDVSGRLVRNILDGKTPAGRYTTAWNLRNDQGAHVAGGIYFYRLQVGDEQKIHRLLVLRPGAEQGS